MSYVAKFVHRDWVPFNAIKTLHENYSRPQNVNVSTASSDKELAASLKLNGWNPDFRMAVEDTKDGKYALHGGFRRYGIISGLVQKGELPDDFKVYCEIYDSLTEGERIDLNLSHNPARIGEANPASVQEFERCWDNWTKKIDGMKPEESPTVLQKAMRLSSYGKAQGYHPLISIGKRIPELKVLERVKNNLAGAAKNADAINLGKAQGKKGDLNKLEKELTQATINLKGEKKDEKIAAIMAQFNEIWTDAPEGNEPKRMSLDLLKKNVEGNDNPLVQIVGFADANNDSDLVQFSKAFNDATAKLLMIKDNAVALEDVSNYIVNILSALKV